MPLSPASALLTTFITPFGFHNFRRLPFGISSAPEHFQRRMSETLNGLEGTVCLMDNIIAYTLHNTRRTRQVTARSPTASTGPGHDSQLRKVHVCPVICQVSRSHGQRRQTRPRQGICHCKIRDVCRFLGMINQLSKFSLHLSDNYDQAHSRAPHEGRGVGVRTAAMRRLDQSEARTRSQSDPRPIRPRPRDRALGRCILAGSQGSSTPRSRKLVSCSRWRSSHVQ